MQIRATTDTEDLLHRMGWTHPSSQEIAAMRLTVVILALSLASAVHAMPVAPLATDDGTVVTVRQGCGAGYRRVGNRCVRNAAVRQFRRCAAGLRLVGGRCIR
jgi:hypothetical protein